MIEDFVQQILIELNLEIDPYDPEEDCYKIPLDDEMLIEIHRFEQEGFSLKSSLCSLPQGSSEETLMDIMAGNLFGQGTGDALLSLDPTGKTLTLSLQVPYEIEYDEFKERLEDFANTMDFWAGEVLRSQNNAPS